MLGVTLFFGGVYLPRMMLPEVIIRIGNFTPPGVKAIQDAWMGTGPHPLHLAAMAGITVIAGFVAASFPLAVRSLPHTLPDWLQRREDVASTYG